MDKIKIVMNKKNSGLSIKSFLKQNHIGRGKIEELRVKKATFINHVSAPLETILKENDLLEINIEEEIDFKADDGKLEIVYEDEYLLIVNKPAQMIIHPDDKNKTGTLVNLVANYYQKQHISRKIRFIHRIDKETTGIVVFAKDFFSEALLLMQIQTHHLYRSYLALIDGFLKQKDGKISAKIATDRHINSKMCISSQGKDAVTTYHVIKEFKNYSLVEFHLLTGRTHQIRVHSAYLNHPLLGDVLYGGNSLLISRVALHSYKVKLIHPITNEIVEVTCNIPQDMQQLIDK